MLVRYVLAISHRMTRARVEQLSERDSLGGVGPVASSLVPSLAGCATC